MERTPPKPELEYRERQDANGVIVRELTPESDIAYGKWLVACNMARQAIYREMASED